MYCDIKTVIDILYKQFVTSSVNTYTGLVDMLFRSYFEDGANGYDRSEPSKLHKGTRTLSSNITDFYLRKDKSVLMGDISGMLKYILDKPQLHISLFDLIIGDALISKPYKKQFSKNHSRDFSDDEQLAEIFYSAVYIAAYRPYFKANGVWHADYYYEQNGNISGLFSGAEPKDPSKFFVGREEELDELHTLVQNESMVFVTGVAGIGKSELVRTYAKKYASEYAHIGYYFYNDYNSELENIIANILPDIAVIRNDISAVYAENLDLLSALGRNVLLIIDNYNVPADFDESLSDLLELKCDIIFISRSHYDDDFAVYDLKELRTFRESYALIQKYYPFDEYDTELESRMHRLVSVTNKYPFSLELCARSMKRGTDTPDTCADALVGGIKTMKARIPANKDGKPKKDTYYEHIKALFEKADLTDDDKYALSYMRFMPESGVPKRLFIELASLEDFTEIDKLIDLGFIHENSDGTISLPSVVNQLIEADIEIAPEELYIFAEKLFALDTNDASKEVLSSIAENLAYPMYLDMIDSDIFIALHLFFQFFMKIGDNFNSDMLLTNLAMVYNKNIFKHRVIYLSDKAQFFELIKDKENFELIKMTIENVENDPHYHTPGSHEPRKRKFTLTAEDAEALGFADDE